MASIQELREKYPQYSDMSDQDFADKFHQKFYSDLPKEDFYKKIGMNQGGDIFTTANQLTPHNVPELVDRAKWLAKQAGSAGAGAAQGLANIVPGGFNVLSKGVHAFNKIGVPNDVREKFGMNGEAPQIEMIDRAPHNLAAKAGELGSFFAVPPAMKGLSMLPGMEHAANAITKIPYIAQMMSHVGNAVKSAPFLSKVGGNALLGSAMSPEHPLAGAVLGGAAPAAVRFLRNPMQAGRDIVGAIPPLERFAEKFKPEKHAEELIQKIAPGKPTIHGNAESLASDIRNAHDVRNENASEFFNHALDRAGHEKIYEKADPLISTAMDKLKGFDSKAKDLKIGDLYDAFKSNPSFRNAHNLQSELGTMMDQIKSNKMTNEERLHLGQIKSVRDRLKKDIDSFLKNRDLNSNENIAAMYKTGSDLYREHVAPFLGDKKLRDIVRGRKSTVKNIHSIFDTPTNKVNKAGKITIGHVNKILQDLPAESKNKIIYSAMGGAPKDANALLEKLSKVENKGFSSYFSPELHEDINILGRKAKNVQNARTLGKWGGIGAGVGTGLGAANALRHFISGGSHD